MLRKLCKILLVLIAFLALGITAIYSVGRARLIEEMEATSRTVDTAAGRMQYSMIGDAGPVILFLHGTPGGFDHRPFFTTAGLDGYRLLTPSRPGYMATPLSTGRTPEEQAMAYSALLDALQIDEVVVWGVSGGGPSAIAFAARYPQRTRAFIGLEVLSRASTEPLDIPVVMRSDFVSWLLLSLATELGGGRAALAMLPAEDIGLIERSDDGLERVRAWLWTIWPVSQRLEGWRNDSEQFQHLSLAAAEIAAPTLILNGTADEAVSYESAQELARTIPGASLYTVEGGNHAMLLSHKEELNAVINKFLHNALSKGEGETL